MSDYDTPSKKDESDEEKRKQEENRQELIKRAAVLAVTPLGQDLFSTITAYPAANQAVHVPQPQPHSLKALYTLMEKAENGQVPSETFDDAVINSIFEDNKIVVFGETDHTSRAQAQYLCQRLHAMKEKGCMHLAIEGDQKMFDYGTGAKDSELNVKEYTALRMDPLRQLFEECKAEGIEPIRFDSHSKKMQELLDQCDKDGFDIYRGFPHDPEKSKRYRKEHKDQIAAMMKERQQITANWSEIIADIAKKNPKAKIAVFCGDGHVDNNADLNPEVINYRDLDEMLAEKLGNTMYVRLQAYDPKLRQEDGLVYRRLGSHYIHKNPAISLGADTPELIIDMPSSPAILLARSLERGPSCTPGEAFKHFGKYMGHSEEELESFDVLIQKVAAHLQEKVNQKSDDMTDKSAKGMIDTLLDARQALHVGEFKNASELIVKMQKMKWITEAPDIDLSDRSKLKTLDDTEYQNVHIKKYLKIIGEEADDEKSVLALRVKWAADKDTKETQEIFWKQFWNDMKKETDEPKPVLPPARPKNNPGVTRTMP